MMNISSIIAFDGASVILMFVLASLSKRLGEAMKVTPFYRLFYIAIALIISSSLINLMGSNFISIAHLWKYTVPSFLRCIAGLMAIIALLRYWNWLFSEFFKG